MCHTYLKNLEENSLARSPEKDQPEGTMQAGMRLALLLGFF